MERLVSLCCLLLSITVSVSNGALCLSNKGCPHGQSQCVVNCSRTANYSDTTRTPTTNYHIYPYFPTHVTPGMCTCTHAHTHRATLPKLGNIVFSYNNYVVVIM